MTDRVLELLRARPDLAELAAFPFGFDVERAYHVEAVHLASGMELEPVAGDDTGGTYFLCGGAAVLYASSEGDAVLIADSVSEALEMLVRLPDWCEGLTADLDEEGLRAAVRAGDAEAREEFAPDLDARRAALTEGLGLPERPLTELFALAESAARRTEPDYLLLNSAELCAYRLDEAYRMRLRDVVLGPGRAALPDAGEGPEPDAFALAELACRQGLRAHATVALIRMLDDTGPDADRLRALSRFLERLGEYGQAARAQSGLLSLQDTDRDRAAEAYALARIERGKGDLPAAALALERAREAVGMGGEGGRGRGSGAPDATVEQWHRRGLGRFIAQQHLELVLVAAESGEAELARSVMGHARLVLGHIAKGSVKALAPLSARARWAVAALEGRSGQDGVPWRPCVFPGWLVHGAVKGVTNRRLR
ncbi:hypothetical protein ACLQ2N_25085 [Streptomyces sp. DT224]|uniref:hypothetical protein n=1 Tax=Streptomyces sp. DT224 TaxID=3393426 RepID=UPI003CEE3976